MANLYWQDSGSQAWGDVLNWWTDDSATTQATKAPWVDSDPAYLTYDLTLAMGATNVPIIYVAIGTGVSGTCYIDNVTNYQGGTINGGTFSATYTTNFATINGGTFSGLVYNEGGNGTIVGGTFTGAVSNGFGGFTNGTIVGGTFTGSVNNDSFSTILGGTFTGPFSNSGIVTGGTFSSGAIAVTAVGANTNVSFSGGGAVLSFPTPASGGGNGLNLSQLLGLPSFIKI